jgi:transcriptional regulator with XRE-family HTH domain
MPTTKKTDTRSAARRRPTAARVPPAAKRAASKAAPPPASNGKLRGKEPALAGDLQIGARLKHARVLAGVRMRELAEKVGCTEGMISKIENARVVPSLPMLQRLLKALDRDLQAFFGSNPDAPGIVQRARQRPITMTDPIREGQGVHYERLVPFGAGNLLEGNIHVIAPDGAKHDPITHQGETMGYVIQGNLELTIDSTPYLLHTGDSFFFKNHLTNSYRNPGPRETRVLWVNTPQVH